MNWFESWFDSKYYSLLYKQRDKQEARFFIDNLVKLLDLKTGSKVLDIACGSGRHASYFHQKGMDVTGIDISKTHIQLAKANSENKIPFEVWDMRKCYKKNTFDVVVNLFTSFGYFATEEENILALNAMRDNLNDSGIIVIDFLNTEKAIQDLVENEQKSIDGIVFEIKRFVQDDFICKNIRFSDNDQSFSFTEKVKALGLTDFNRMFNFAHLKIINVFGDYDLSLFDIENSNRLIILAKKWD